MKLEKSRKTLTNEQEDESVHSLKKKKKGKDQDG